VSLAALLLTGCIDSANRVTFDGAIQIEFDGKTYFGYEQALGPIDPRALRAAGVASQLHGPIPGNTVLALPGVDPGRAVIMEASPGLPYAYVLFVERTALLASGTQPFGMEFVELCPFVALEPMREGCPGEPSRTGGPGS
jgi:hypothetical protein